MTLLNSVSPFLSLPLELRTQIAKSGLTYFDLKRLGATCKTNKDLIQQPTFDSSLFRGPPISNLEKGTQVTLHPLLLNLHSLFITSPSEAMVKPATPNGKAFVCTELSAVDEAATNPPVKELLLSSRVLLRQIRSRHIHHKHKALTVRQVVQIVARNWRRPYLCKNCGGDHGHGSLFDYCVAEGLFERVSLEGWKQSRVEEDGIVLLSPLIKKL